ncbi:MAG: prepilin-type N-terminal cleavage/methylation domain-containing protein [Gemmataceae bacterium]|nr:prepilin-type N-terminal cleavage/methylation domain-containing protein [Gemmataceae bacterium]MDW8242553.1 prepilin-type N-terminal cleavage/methylation domain-containing protein [Thermogemmata sp.]
MKAKPRSVWVNTSEPVGRYKAFTLIELLVVMGLIAAAAAVAMMVVPAALERDRVVEAVNQVQNMLDIARARALRDGHPHGVRVIIDASRSAPPSLILASEVQYIEMPPVFVPSRTIETPNDNPANYPYLRFLYSYDGSGQITNRRCQLVNIPADMLPPGPVAVTQRLILVIPVFNGWYVIRHVTPIANGLELTLDTYPDDRLGAAGTPTGPATDYPVVVLHSYLGLPSHRSLPQFGIYRAPQPLLGEAVVRLPDRTCIDLSPGLSQPDGSSDWAAGHDYDLLFIPSGQLSPYGSNRGAGQVFLWFRDPDKPEGAGRMDPGYYGGITTLPFQEALRRGGEQMLIAIKAHTGAVITTPIHWPDGTNNDLYWFARRALVGQ